MRLFVMLRPVGASVNCSVWSVSTILLAVYGAKLYDFDLMWPSTPGGGLWNCLVQSDCSSFEWLCVTIFWGNFSLIDYLSILCFWSGCFLGLPLIYESVLPSRISFLSFATFSLWLADSFIKVIPPRGVCPNTLWAARAASDDTMLGPETRSNCARKISVGF